MARKGQTNIKIRIPFSSLGRRRLSSWLKNMTQLGFCPPAATCAKSMCVASTDQILMSFARLPISGCRHFVDHFWLPPLWLVVQLYWVLSLGCCCKFAAAPWRLSQATSGRQLPLVSSSGLRFGNYREAFKALAVRACPRGFMVGSSTPCTHLAHSYSLSSTAGRPNPSIERRSTCKPVAPDHVKR